MKFEVYEDRGGKWRWRLKARNGEIVAVTSEGYADKAGALRSVELMKRKDVRMADVVTIGENE